jgi:hypothetical protein
MTAQRIGRLYVLLNGINDTAYFGFIAIQFFLLRSTLYSLLPAEHAELSSVLTLIIIASQLLWQILAEGPTGALADMYGRAWAVAASFWCRLIAIGLLVGSAAANLSKASAYEARLSVAAAIILAQILMATGEAFLEGSVEAWLRDECELADPVGYGAVVDKAFERSAVVQNVAILVSQTTFLLLLRYSDIGRISLGLVAAGLCLIGAAFSHWLSRREGFTRTVPQKPGKVRALLSETRRGTKGILLKLRDSYGLLVRSDEILVRRLIAFLILPFPCWVMISWFFTAFVRAGMPRDPTADRARPLLALVLLGATLGVARVIGAWVGKLVSRRGEEKVREGEKYLLSVFEKAIRVNVLFLFAAALLLALKHFTKIELFPSSDIVLLLPAAFVIKGTEEIIKLIKNKILASALPDSNIRATTLSLISVAQNTFGFMVILIGGLLAFMVTEGIQQVIMIFIVCALFGFAGWLLTRKLSPLPPAEDSVAEGPGLDSAAPGSL